MTLSLSPIRQNQNVGGAYRGSFNPMSPNHSDLIKQVVKDGLSPLVVSCSETPNKDLAPLHLRFQLASMMLELLPQDIQKHIHLLKPEEQANYATYITAIRQYLNQPAGKLNLFVGGDSVLKILKPSWKSFAPLTDFNIIAYKRYGITFDQQALMKIAQTAGTTLQFRPIPEKSPLSSTKIRAWMREWNVQELSKFYPTHILDFLKEHLKEFTRF
jgi:nicotinic acid mononucleotide adenylyltransferase